MNILKFCAAVILVLLSFVSNVSNAFQNPPMPTLTAMPPIFTDDTCKPPCWQGLIPGESTAEDAAQFLIGNDHIGIPIDGITVQGEIDPQTGLLVNGEHIFHLLPWERPDQPLGLYSRVFIKGGVVDRIALMINEYVTLRQIIQRLGLPDEVHFMGMYGGYIFKLFYQEARTELWVQWLQRFSSSDCDVSSIGDIFWLSDAYYYSPKAAVEPFEAFGIDQLQPAFLAYWVDDRNVALQKFQSWLSGEDRPQSCSEAWRALPEEIILPTVMPTFVSTALQTPSATP